jgi:hypothetical protein
MSTCRRAWPIALGASLSISAIALQARADLAPPPRYEDTCTIERQARPGERCESCAADFRDVTRCARTHASRGLELRCRTRGESAWAEIWCGAPAAAASPGSASASASAEPPATAVSAPSSSASAPSASSAGAARAPGPSSGCALGAGSPSSGGGLGALGALITLLAAWAALLRPIGRGLRRPRL